MMRLVSTPNRMAKIKIFMNFFLLMKIYFPSPMSSQFLQIHTLSVSHGHLRNKDKIR